jgi:hypothetical protein
MSAAKAEVKKEVDPNNPDNLPMFVSTTGGPVMVALLNGHAAAVGVEPTPLHPRFHRAAVMLGAVPESMRHSVAAEDMENPEVTRQKMIIAEMSKMASEGADDPRRQAELFTGDGVPNTNLLSSRLGFPVSASERDDAWTAYTNEAD